MTAEECESDLGLTRLRRLAEPQACLDSGRVVREVIASLAPGIAFNRMLELQGDEVLLEGGTVFTVVPFGARMQWEDLPCGVPSRSLGLRLRGALDAVRPRPRPRPPPRQRSVPVPPQAELF